MTVTEVAFILAGDLSSYDALVFNTRRENLSNLADLRMSADEQDGMKNFISSEKGFVCLHISGCLPDHWPEFHDIIGGGWITGTSFHPPYGHFSVNISKPGHVGVRGVSDFSTDDEIYTGLVIKEGNDVFRTGDAEDGEYPWGPDRVVTKMPVEHSLWDGPAPTDTGRYLCFCWAMIGKTSRVWSFRRLYLMA